MNALQTVFCAGATCLYPAMPDTGLIETCGTEKGHRRSLLCQKSEPQPLFLHVQRPSQANMVQCDEALNAIFGEKMVTMSSLSGRIAPLLQPCPRPLLEYTIQCAANSYLLSVAHAPNDMTQSPSELSSLLSTRLRSSQSASWDCSKEHLFRGVVMSQMMVA